MNTFRNKLNATFFLLGLFSLFQVVVLVSLVNSTQDNANKSQLSSALYSGFVELLSQKHQLRLEVTNALVGFRNDPKQRQVYYTNMMRILSELDELSDAVVAINANDHSRNPENKERIENLRVLRKGVLQVGKVLDEDQFIRDGHEKKLTLQERRIFLSDLFDIADARDLRAVLFQSISRERLVSQRDEVAKDTSLKTMRYVIISIFFVSMIGIILFARFFSNRIRFSFAQFMKGLNSFQQGQYTVKISDLYDQEFSKLAKQLNALSQQISQNFQANNATIESLEIQLDERTSDFQETLHRLEKMDLRRKQMFADISHELRTPTTAIRGEAEITLRYNSTNLSDYKLTLEKIIDYSHALSSVIDDVLTLARSDIDAFVLKKEPLSMLKLTDRIILNYQKKIQEKSIQLIVTEQSDAQVFGDAMRLGQVLQIALENAISYTPPQHQITMSSRIDIENPDQPQYSITIRNQGQGIPEAELSRVFDRHYRGRYAQTVRPEGSGLGLPLAKTIVNAHLGKIMLTSVEHEFTELTIVLPIMPNEGSEGL